MFLSRCWITFRRKAHEPNTVGVAGLRLITAALVDSFQGFELDSPRLDSPDELRDLLDALILTPGAKLLN